MSAVAVVLLLTMFGHGPEVISDGRADVEAIGLASLIIPKDILAYMPGGFITVCCNAANGTWVDGRMTTALHTLYMPIVSTTDYVTVDHPQPLMVAAAAAPDEIRVWLVDELGRRIDNEKRHLWTATLALSVA